MNKTWQDSAPSNIALIKYMGKTDHSQNLPTNVSISYTVDHLQTFVELKDISSESDVDLWEPLEKEGCQKLELNEKSQQRYLNHLAFLKKEFSYQGNFLVKSVNNFPAACGIASSASSFAALTKAFATAMKDLQEEKSERLQPHHLCHLSRQGSGSSCRSFFSGWVAWQKEEVQQVDIPYSNLIHLVCVAGGEEKEVSTSNAHKIVPTSSLFAGRVPRAEKRYEELVASLKKKNWEQAYNTAWAEFWDMHSLFETSSPHFGYMNAGSLKAMNTARDLWKKEKDGPLVTMDAGPNVHFFFREDQKEMADSLNKQLQTDFKVLSKEDM